MNAQLLSYLRGDEEKELPQLPQRRRNPLRNLDGTINVDYDPLVLQQQRIAEAAAATVAAQPKPGLLERIGRQQAEVQRFEGEALGSAGEIGLGIAGGMVGYIGGASTFIANAIADLGKQPEANYWKRLYEHSHAIASNFAYQPRTETGQLGMELVGQAMHPLMEFSRIAADAPLVRMVLTEDQRYAVRFAHELLTLAVVDRGLNAALSSTRGSVASFRDKFGKVASGSDKTTATKNAMVRSAERLMDVASTDPTINAELLAARERLAQASQQGIVDTTQAAEVSRLTQLVDDLGGALRDLPEGVPQRVRDQVQADLAQAREQLRKAAEVEAAPMTAAELEPPAPGTIRLYRSDLPPSMRGPETDFNISHVARSDLQYIRAWRDSHAPSADIYYIDVPWNANDPMTPTPPASITGQQRAQMKLLPGGEGKISKNVPSGPTVPTTLADLADLKARAREGLRSNEATRTGLERLGYTPEQATELASKMRNVRAKKLEKPTDVELEGAMEIRGKMEPSLAEPTELATAPEVIPGTHVASAESLWSGALPEAKRLWLGPKGSVRRQWNQLTLQEQTRIVDATRTPVDVLAARPTIDVTPAIEKPRRARPRKKIVPEQESALQPAEIPTTSVSVAEPAPTGPIRHRTSTTLEALRSDITRISPDGTEGAVVAPIQVRTIGDRPVAVLLDTRNLNVLSSINEIRKQLERGRVSAEVARTMELSLQRQAEIAGVPIEEAHGFPAEWLVGEVTRLVQEHKLELYRAKRTKAGVEYEQVPVESIIASNKLADANAMKPSGITREEASTYVAERTKDLGPATIEDIQRALESGEDIKPRLPQEAHDHFDRLREIYRQGIDESTSRNAVDILTDLLDLIAPPDIPQTHLAMLSVFGMTPQRKAAMYRLYADAVKAKMKFGEMLRRAGLPISERIIMQRHMQQLTKPPIPPPPIEPKYVALDPRVAAAGDVVFHQRQLAGGKNGPPVYLSEARLLQESLPIHRRVLVRLHGKALGNPYYVLRRANVEPIMYSYREAQTVADLWKAELQKDLNKLTKSLNIPAREKIGDFAIGQQPKGEKLVQAAGRTVPTSLTPDEMNFYQTSRELLKYVHGENNAVRVALGRKPLPTLDDYWPFVRAFSVAQELGMTPNMVLDSPKKMAAMVSNYAHVPFVHGKARTKAIYSPRNDAFELLQSYVNSAIDQITVAPFLEKLNELINHPMPRLQPVEGRSANWALRTANPHLHSYLNRWRNDLITGTQSGLWFADDPGVNRLATRAMQFAGRSQTLTQLAGKTRSALVQVTTIVETLHQLGLIPTIQGFADLMYDGVFRGFAKHNEYLQHSYTVRTRNLTTALDDVTTALIGRNLGDFVRLIGRAAATPIDFVRGQPSSGAITKLQTSATNIGTAFMRFVDTIVAHAAYHAAFKFAKEKLRLDDVTAGRKADDFAVMTQGGAMPGDVAGIQRTAVGKLGTQFQRFVISTWNYMLNEVFAGETTMKRLYREAQGKPAPNFYYGLVKSIATFVALQEAMNFVFESAGMHASLPSPIVQPMKRGIETGGDVPTILGTLAAELAEYVPIISPTKYGRGIAGPFIDTIREAAETFRGTPLAYKLRRPDDTSIETFLRIAGSPIGKLLSFPFAGAIGTWVHGQDRGEGVWGSLVGSRSDPTHDEEGTIRETRSPRYQSIRRKIR